MLYADSISIYSGCMETGGNGVVIMILTFNQVCS